MRQWSLLIAGLWLFTTGPVWAQCSDSRKQTTHCPAEQWLMAAQSLTIVGQQDDGCGNLLSSRERRVAILQRQVRTGMTRADVESALGSPNRIKTSNGRSTYQYRNGKQQTLAVSFDERGCVSSKSKP